MDGVSLRAQVQARERAGEWQSPALADDRHEYLPPYDRDRMGNPLPQRREPYVDADTMGQRLQVLTLLAAFSVPEEASGWETVEDGWELAAPTGRVQVRVSPSHLVAEGGRTGTRWQVPIGDAPPAA